MVETKGAERRPSSSDGEAAQPFRLLLDDVDTVDARAARSVPAPANEGLDRVGLALEYCLDGPVGVVADPACDPARLCLSRGREAEADALDKAPDEDAAANHGAQRSKVVSMAHVSEILRGKSGDVLKIEASATVYDALVKIVDANVGSILVTEGGEVTGIMTERDYLRKIAVLGRTSHNTKVSEIMTAPLIYVTPQTTIEEAMAIMTDRRIRHLPVVEDDEVVGIVSIGDVVKFQSQEQSFQIKYLTDYISGR